MKNLAPIVVFAFNRPDVLKTTLVSLKDNQLAKDSDLYIFIDGPRNSDDVEKIEKVSAICDQIDGFKTITIKQSDKNKGLAPSIISGVTEIINKYGKVIVVEDDLFLSKSFLKYMNQMLNSYEKRDDIFQVSGFGTKINPPKYYHYDVYLNERAQSWTWGTWIDRWNTVDWEVKDYRELSRSWKKRRCFNKCGSDLFKMLKGYMDGKNNSWYIRFNYSMYKQHKYSVNPVRSLVRNDGFRSDATHCNAYNRYKIDFEDFHKGDFIAPESLKPSNEIIKQAVKYWSIHYRIYGKIMTLISKFK